MNMTSFNKIVKYITEITSKQVFVCRFVVQHIPVAWNPRFTDSHSQKISLW